MKIDNKQFLENIMHALDELAIVAITDTFGKIIEVNQRFSEISGYSSRELIGSTHKVVNSGYHSREVFAELWTTILSGKIWKGELKNRKKNGSYYWVDTSIVPVFDENQIIKYFVSIRYDITDKKENEFNLNNLIEASNDGLFIYDLSGKIVWTNQIVNKFFEVEIKSKYIQEIFADSKLVFHCGEGKLNFQYKNEIKTFEVSTKNYFFNGHASFLVVLCDITDKIKIETQMMYQDRLATIGMLASGVAHEVGTPLGVMRGRAEMIINKKHDPEYVSKNVEIFIQQIDRISKLVKSLLEVSHGVVSSPSELNFIKKTVDELHIFISHELMKNNIQIVCEGFSEGNRAYFNGSQLFQVLLNLSLNSIYSLKEKKKNQIDFNPKIEIRMSENNEFIKIEFIDNANGIDSENLKKVFSPFFSTKPLGEGTGLGLATSYRNVEGWGGKMEVQSQPGEWTIFTILLRKR